MANTTPYDHTTTPPTPQSSDESQTPPLLETVTKWRANVPPGQSPPSYASHHTPRPAPRESSTVTQNDDLSKGVRVWSLSERDAPGYFDFLKDSPPKIGTQQGWTGQKPPHPEKKPSRQSQDKDLKLEPPPSLLIERLQDDVPMKITTPKPGELPTLSTGQLPTRSNTSTKIKPTDIARIPRRYRPEIFNISFSFSAPSRRRPSDIITPISPRTCTSSNARSTNPAPDEPFKRQRIDASTSTTPPQASPRALAEAHNLRSSTVLRPGTGPSQWWSSNDPLKLKDPKHFRVVPKHKEPHPGKLIDFSVANKSLEAIKRQREEAENDDASDEEEYHNYLDRSQRRYYSPSPHHTRILYNFDTITITNSPHQHRKGPSNKQSRILPLSPPTPPNVQDRRRASSLPRPPQLTTHSSTPSTSSSSSTILPLTPSTRTPSTSSDPGVSAARFLTHVRASQEARAAKLRQQVFRDEDWKGWLGDEPL